MFMIVYGCKALESGVIGVIAIEHDSTSIDAPFIKKGKDGNAEK